MTESTDASEGLERDPAGFAYPPYVRTKDERERWDRSAAIAAEVFDEGVDTNPALVWQATRSLYSSHVRT